MTLPEKIKKYGLTQKDWYQHAHYTIITRMGIDKIQAYESIDIVYEAITSTPEFCVVKAIGGKGELVIETFGSAKYGVKEWVKFDKPNQYGKEGKWKENGNTSTWYVMEMAEKRAMSRAVLKITGFYELGVFGEDESEDFKPTPTPKKESVKVEAPRKEALTLEQFQATKNATPKQILVVLEKFRMADDQRKALEAIANK
jgi:hypothetical protein